MVLTHGVENDMGTRTTVVDVAKDVQLVDGQSLNDVADGDDKALKATELKIEGIKISKKQLYDILSL